MDVHHLHRVCENKAGSRLDFFILQIIGPEKLSRARVQEWIKQGLVRVDGRVCLKPGQKLQQAQTVHIQVPDAGSDLQPLSGRLEIVYQNRELVVIDKQAGMSVHPAPSESGPTLINYLVHACPQLLSFPDRQRPGIVHRLDKDTTGLMVVALTRQARENLSRQFFLHRVEKKYLALVLGCVLKEQGVIDLPLARDERNKTRMTVAVGGRRAVTSYRVLEKDAQSGWSVLKIDMQTGRTHQIRVHLSHLGHPVMGDSVYGGRHWEALGWKKRFLPKLAHRQLLHSWFLGFEHPGSQQKLEFTRTAPKNFLRTLLWLKRKCQKAVITGSPGSGKSTVLALFQSMGCPVFDADACVERLYHPGHDGWLMLRRRFGSRFTPEDGRPVDRKALLAAILKDRSILDEVNHLIHPLVEGCLADFWDRNRDRRLAVAEVPLWFESGMDSPDCLAVGIFCPDGLRLQRACQSRERHREVFFLLDGMQSTQAEKIQRCDLVLDNSQDAFELERRVAGLARVLMHLRIKQKRVDIKQIKQMLLKP